MSLGQIVRRRREELGLTQDQVAMQAGISKPYLSNIETGRARNPPSDGVLRCLEGALSLPGGQLVKLAHLARTPADIRQEHELLEAEVDKLRAVVRELMRAGSGAEGSVDLEAPGEFPPAGGNVELVSAGRLVPVINKVAAGYPQHFTDLDYPTSIADEYVRCVDLHDPQAFAARVVGDSMEPEFHEGDIVVFSPNAPVRSGDDCFVRLDEEGGTMFKRYYQDSPGSIRLQPLNSKYPAEIYPSERLTGLWPAVQRIRRLR